MKKLLLISLLSWPILSIDTLVEAQQIRASLIITLSSITNQNDRETKTKEAARDLILYLTKNQLGDRVSSYNNFEEVYSDLYLNATRLSECNDYPNVIKELRKQYNLETNSIDIKQLLK
jgi:hypothetical protein